MRPLSSARNLFLAVTISISLSLLTYGPPASGGPEAVSAAGDTWDLTNYTYPNDVVPWLGIGRTRSSGLVRPEARCGGASWMARTRC